MLILAQVYKVACGSCSLRWRVAFENGVDRSAFWPKSCPACGCPVTVSEDGCVPVHAVGRSGLRPVVFTGEGERHVA